MASYQKALTLYENEQYQAAQALFSRLQNVETDEQLQVNSQYYYAVSAIKRNQAGSEELMETFVRENPTSTKRNNAFVMLPITILEQEITIRQENGINAWKKAICLAMNW